jgi:hypothetical protein
LKSDYLDRQAVERIFGVRQRRGPATHGRVAPPTKAERGSCSIAAPGRTSVRSRWQFTGCCSFWQPSFRAQHH